MRIASASVSPRARWSGCSATGLVKRMSLAAAHDGSDVESEAAGRSFSRPWSEPRFTRGEPPPSAHAARALGDLGRQLHVHQDRRPRAHADDFSAFCYATAALYAARRLVSVSPIVSSVGALATASICLAPFAAFQLPSRFPSLGVSAAVLALSVGGTGVAYVLYYALLAGAGASRSILVTYLVPALALGYGAVFLGEAVTAPAVAGLVLVLAGVGLGTGALRLGGRTRLASEP